MYFDVDLDVGVDRLGAGDVAGLELLDQADAADAADETDRAGGRLQRRGGADEERALLLGRTPGRPRSGAIGAGGVASKFIIGSSTIANCTSGFSTRRRTPCRPQRPRRRRWRTRSRHRSRGRRSLPGAACRCRAAEASVGVSSFTVTPKSALARSMPAAAESLNDWSPRPSRSNVRPTVTAEPSPPAVVVPGAAVVAAGAAVVAAGAWVVADDALSSSSPQAARASTATTPVASKRLLVIIFSPFSGTIWKCSRSR